MHELKRDRSYEPITDADLRRLGRIAESDRHSLFERIPELGRLYAERLIAVALCQGAGLHRVNGLNGVKDFDVWSFFSEHSERPFPYRRRGTADFGDSRFGKTPGSEEFEGRRVDLIGRSLPVDSDRDVVEKLRTYLREGKTASARSLAEKGVVLIGPAHLLGTVVWPMSVQRRR